MKELTKRYQKLYDEQLEIEKQLSEILGTETIVFTENDVFVYKKLSDMRKCIVFSSSGVKYQSWETIIDGVRVSYHEPIGVDENEDN